MTKKSTVLSCVLATLSGICFVTGMSLLTSEGSVVNYGTGKETVIND